MTCVRILREVVEGSGEGVELPGVQVIKPPLDRSVVEEIGDCFRGQAEGRIGLAGWAAAAHLDVVGLGVQVCNISVGVVVNDVVGGEGEGVGIACVMVELVVFFEPW